MTAEKPETEAKTNTYLKRWATCGATAFVIVAACWWLMKPEPTQAPTGSAITATAPQAPPKPHNANGAPRSISGWRKVPHRSDALIRT